MKINYSKFSFTKLTFPTLICTILVLLTSSCPLQAQHIFYPGEILRLEGYTLGYNIEVHDINRDKKPDIISGNFNNTSVFYGGTGVLDSKADLFYRGRCVALTDYNGDGYKDMIALHFTDTLLYNDYKGEFLFYWGSPNGPYSIDTTADDTIPLPIDKPYSSYLCSGIFETATRTGDLNHDGKGDLIFQAPMGVRTGRIIIYLGREVPCDTPDFNIIPSNKRERELGDYYDVADINGDHYDDLAMTSRIFRKNGGIDSACSFYVFYGSDNFRCSIDSPSVKYTCRVRGHYASTGWISQNFSLDDINGDNIADIVVGNYPNTYFYYGKPSGIDTIPSFTLTDPDTTDETISAGGITQNIGDYNHDGYNDFLISNVGWKTFGLLLGGPHVSNKNPFGIRGYLDAHDFFFPNKALPAGYQDPTGDLYPDFICSVTPLGNDAWSTILVFVGDNHQITDDVESEVSNLESFNLNQNYPNPFNPSTTISFTLDQSTIKNNRELSFTIYDLLGRELYSEVNSYSQPGTYQIKVDAGKLSLSSGTYFYQIRGHNFKSTKKMLLLK